MTESRDHPVAATHPPARRRGRRWSRVVASAAAVLVAAGAVTISPATTTVAHAGGTDTFSVTVPPQPVAAGSAFVISVTAVNGGSKDVGYAGRVHFTSSDPRAVLPLDYTYTTGSGGDDGNHAFSNIVLGTPGAQTITATDSTSGITGTGTVHVRVGPASQLVFVATPPGTSPPNAAAGTPFSGTVRAEDAAGNIVTAYTGTIGFTTTDPVHTLPAAYTFTGGDAGSHTFANAFTLNTAGTSPQTITATDTVTGSITGAVSVIVSGAATSFAVTPTAASNSTPYPDQTHSATSVLVQPLDHFGHEAVSYTGTASFSSSDPAVVITGDGSGCTTPCHVFTAADVNGYSLAVTFRTVGPQTITATDTNPAITGQGAVTVTNAPASAFVITGLGTTESTGVEVPFGLTARDQYGDIATNPPYTGTVNLTSSDTQATLTPRTFTFTKGYAGVAPSGSLEAMFLTPGTQSITATDSLSSTVTGSASTNVVTGGPATHLFVGAPSDISANQSFSITVTAQDASSLTSNGYTGTIRLTSTVPGFIAPAPYTYTVGSSGDNGVHIFSSLSFPAGGTSGTITATDTVTSSIAGSSGTITVAGSPTKYVFTAIPSAAVAAGTPQQYSLQVEDASGNIATSYTGTSHFTSSDTHAVLPSNHVFTTGNCGIPRSSNVNCGVVTVMATLETSGGQTITAADTALPQTITPATTGTVTVTSGSASQLLLSAPPTATAGTPTTIRVTARDQYGNTATGYTGTVALAAPGDPRASVPAPYTFVGGDNGSHAFAVTFATAGNQVATAADQATDSGVSPGTSNVVAVAPGVTSTYALSSPTSTPAGAPFALGVVATDQFGNVTPTYTGSVQLSSTDTTAALPANYTFTTGSASGTDNGVHTFTVTLNGLGAQTLTVTDTSASSITRTAAVTVSGAATQLVLQMAAATAGVAEPLTVTAEDAAGNTAASYTGTIHFTSTDGAATLPPDYTFTSGTPSADNGVHVFSITMATAGSQSVTATDTGANPPTGSTTVPVTSGNIASFAVAAPPSATAGTPVSVLVTAHDGSGNVVTSYAGTVQLTSSDGAAALPAAYTFAAADSGSHGFSVTLRTAGPQTITATDSVAQVTGTSTATTVAAAPAASFTVTAASTATAGSPVTVTVTALDQYGNIATAYSGRVHFSSNDSAALLPANYTFTGSGGDSGVHTFSTVLRTAGTSTVSATDISGTPAGTSGNITVAPAPAATLVLSAPTSSGAGTPISVVVSARDQYGNTATTYSGTVHFTSTDPAATLPADYTFVSGNAGTHTVTVTLHTVGSRTVSATDTVTASITGTTHAIAVTSGTATRFTVSAPASSVANAPLSVTVTAIDGSGNTAGAYTGTVHLTSSDAAATLPANYTFATADAGSHRFTVTLRTTGSQTVSATDTTTSTITGVSGSINVTASAPFHPTGVGPPAVAVAPDGSQLVFWRAANKHLIEAYYQGGNWNGPVDVTGSFFGNSSLLASAPSAAVTTGGIQLVFWQGTNNHLYEAWYDTAWNGPVDVTSSFLGNGAALSSPPSVTVMANGTQLVFWKGPANHLIEAWYAQGWHGPVDVSASYFHNTALLASAPSVTVSGTQQLVFWQGTNSHLYEAWYANGWNGPVDWTTSAFGGSSKLISAPTASVTSNGTQVLFWEGANGHLIEAWYTGGWNGPVDVTRSFFGNSSALTSAPASAITADGTQIVFWQGANSSLHEAWYSGGWNGPVAY